MRGKETATDNASTESAMLEYIECELIAKQKASLDDIFMLVQATSPLTRSIDFENGLNAYNKKKAHGIKSILSVTPYKRFIWEEYATNDGTVFSSNYDHEKRPRRQEMEALYQENGAFYISTVGDIENSKNRLTSPIGVCVMDEHTSYEIDEPSDWLIMENIAKSLGYGEDRPIVETKEEEEEEIAQPIIKLFVTDIDGTLTDGGMYYDARGDAMKKFNTQDGMAITNLGLHGIPIVFITGEESQININRANKLGVSCVIAKSYDKLKDLTALCEQNGISLSDVAYIGDDINDINLLMNVGICACPSNASPKVKEIPNIIKLNSKGGEGAVREFIDTIFNFDYDYKQENNKEEL